MAGVEPPLWLFCSPPPNEAEYMTKAELTIDVDMLAGPAAALGG